MVVLDDKAAGGHLYSYGKLLGTTAETQTDLNNVANGIETSRDRTLRLFYVVCSRAKESLAVVLYDSDPESARGKAASIGWFAENEIILKKDLPAGSAATVP